MKSIGRLHGTPIVEGDSNIVTNQILYSKDENGKIVLHKRGNDGILKTITPEAKEVVAPTPDEPQEPQINVKTLDFNFLTDNPDRSDIGIKILNDLDASFVVNTMDVNDSATSISPSTVMYKYIKHSGEFLKTLPYICADTKSDNLSLVFPESGLGILDYCINTSFYIAMPKIDQSRATIIRDNSSYPGEIYCVCFNEAEDIESENVITNYIASTAQPYPALGELGVEYGYGCLGDTLREQLKDKDTTIIYSGKKVGDMLTLTRIHSGQDLSSENLNFIYDIKTRTMILRTW